MSDHPRQGGEPPSSESSGVPLSPGISVWVQAIRPKTLSAAAAPVFVGAGLGAFHGTFRLLPVLAALLGGLLIQVGTNLANDYFDFLKGGDTADRLGPVRVTQAGLIAPEAVKRAMILTLGAAFLVGVYLVWVGGWPIVIVGLASLVCAVAYTGGPFSLAYNGLGDLFVFVFFGLVAVGGTFWVQALTLEPDVLLAGAAMGALNTAILVVNNLRDIETDGPVGKRTLAVLLGARATRVEYFTMGVIAEFVPVIGIFLFGWPLVTLLATAAVLTMAPPLKRVMEFEDPRELNPALGQTARTVALYGLLLALALAFG